MDRPNRPRWSAEALDADETIQLEDRIRKYGELLLDPLKLGDYLSSTATECHIYIVDTPDPSGNTGPGIHCLAWELLEAIQHDTMPKLRLRVTRISDIPSPMRPMRFGKRTRTMGSFAAVQADTTLEFHILLVVARDFSRTGAERDPEPDLAQWPLMNIQRKLRSRMLLEVVRPGSREELEDHLEVRASQGTFFHLVHFDLHGSTMSDEHGVQVPWLAFAKQNPITSHGYQVPGTVLVKAESIAQVLARYQIENIVLNASLSAYNRSGSGTSLAHIFLEYGICNISAMWFYVHWQTVATYLDAFYDKLLVQCKDFHLAAYCGREAIRQKPTNRGGCVYQDFFLCVNYTRKMLVEVDSPKRALLAGSQDSTTLNTLAKSFKNLGDRFMKDEPVLRMQLHLLELEYKLMTFRIVYASDLRRPGSKLPSTIDKMVDMWLTTNLFKEVLYYKGKDFARSRLLPGSVRPREKRTSATNGGYLQLFLPKSTRALRQTLHVVHDVDAVLAPGFSPDAAHYVELEQRGLQVQAGLQQFAERLHAEGHSYLLFLGSEDAQ